MSSITDEEFAEIDEMINVVENTVYPILDEIEEEFQSEIMCPRFTMFISLIASLVDQGWTKEELIEEVKTHCDDWKDRSIH